MIRRLTVRRRRRQRSRLPACRTFTIRGMQVVAALALVVGLVAGCTVRVELAVPRVAEGDLAASSAGLSGHHRWVGRIPEARDPPSEDGITLADVSLNAVAPVELFPRRDVAPAEPPLPRLRPDVSGGMSRTIVLLPPPAKPLVLAAPARHADELEAAGESRLAQGVAGAVLAPIGDPAGPLEPPAGQPVAASPAAPGASRGRSGDPAAAPRVIALAPGLELARADQRYDLVWLAIRDEERRAPILRPRAAGWRSPIRLFPLAEPA